VTLRPSGLGALLAATLALAPGPASADWQLSARLAAGGGIESSPEQDTDGLFALAVRSELLAGPHRVRRVRVGPALELRTQGFETAEAAAGLALVMWARRR